MVIPVEVNGTKLTFLLDTGVSSTIMFSLSEIDSLALNDSKLIRLRGLGEGGSIPALKSSLNRIKIGKVTDINIQSLLFLINHLVFPNEWEYQFMES